MKTFTAVLYREENVYIAECPEVGTVSQGESVEKAVANLQEATELYLAEAPHPQGVQTYFPMEEVHHHDF